MIIQMKFLILYIILILSEEEIVIDRKYVENPMLYKNEICSYNGSPYQNLDNEKNKVKIECTCYSSYVDEPREDHKKYVGDQLVHCSYKRKKRFTTFF